MQNTQHNFMYLWILKVNVNFVLEGTGEQGWVLMKIKAINITCELKNNNIIKSMYIMNNKSKEEV